MLKFLRREIFGYSKPLKIFPSNNILYNRPKFKKIFTKLGFIYTIIKCNAICE